MVVATGGCHCGAVRWEADVPAQVTVHDCNCSMCAKLGYQHIIVPASRFRLLKGETIRTYTFGHHIAQHHFCSVCGVKSHYVPRSNPDGFSLNYRCIDNDPFEDVVIEAFDGQNWEANAGALSHLSQE